MLRHIPLSLTLLLTVGLVAAQRTSPPTEAELAQITERGKRLVEYDLAAWHGSDAVMAMQPAQSSVIRYIARKEGTSWTVAFGRLNNQRDKFLIVYEAAQGATPTEFTAKKHDWPKEDVGFFLSAAKAIDIALADFKGEPRPYNVAVLPADSKQFWVYVIPAQTKSDVFPLGGDARYLVSEDGSRIVAKRQLHKSIIEFAKPKTASDVQGSYHTAILDDIPEDTDVFHVLVRKPSVPEWIATHKYVFRIEADGTIKYLMTREAFSKIKGK
jgi:hypothetical protein